MDVSIIIVTYNTKQMTLECIDSIYEKTQEVSFEVILVDNASVDGSKELFSKDKRITYIYSDENVGFGKGNNLGLKHATGKYIFCLNSDTLLLNNALKKFYDFMEAQPENVGCCGCLLVDYYGNPTGSFGDIQGVKYFAKSILGYNHVRLKTNYQKQQVLKYPLKVGFVNGADMFIRRTVINECGAFDPDFFMYYEETEMQHRFHKHGYESWIINTPWIKHLVGASNKNKNNNSLRQLIGQLHSRYLYIEKTKSKCEKYFIYLMHFLYLPLLPFKRSLPGEKKQLLDIILSPFKI